MVIARSGSGSREMFVVRRIVSGEGVERKFPLHSPKIEKVDVKRSGVTRRAKLYYLRERTGKAVRLLVYNGQVTSPTTERMRGLAEQNGIPVVGLSETIARDTCICSAYKTIEAVVGPCWGITVRSRSVITKSLVS